VTCIAAAAAAARRGAARRGALSFLLTENAQKSLIELWQAPLAAVRLTT
jgi:hypothetical protein